MKTSTLFLACVLSASEVLLAVPGKGQGALTKRITLELRSETLPYALSKIEKLSGFRLVYPTDQVARFTDINLKKDSRTVQRTLELVLQHTGFEFRQDESTILIFQKLTAKHIPSADGYDYVADTSLRGKVTDKNGQPLYGVSVMVKGTRAATVTDENGMYILTVSGKSNPVLVFSYVGYTSREISAFNNSVVNVSLEATNNSLDQVVVTAYTAEKKKDITGAVSIVNVGEMGKLPAGLVTNQLQGQASGVTVISSGQPGADPQIRIRGINTFGNNSPLYVVDGVPTQNISDLNINDVASVQVLKDAGAASIYGSRASNGVIIFTTKKGRGKVNVQYDGYYGTQVPKSGNVWGLLNPQENADLAWMASKNSGITPSDPLYGNGATPVLPDYLLPLAASEGDPAVDPSKYYVNPNFTDVADYNSFYRITKANKAGTDWYHALFREAPTTSHNITVNGGGEKGNYLFSLNYLNQQGSLINTYLKRYTLRSNAQYVISKNIRIGENLAASVTHNPRINDMSQNSMIFFTLQLSPIIPVHDIMGNYAGVYGLPFNGINPVAAMERTGNNKTTSNRLFGNIYADVDFLKYFTFHTSFGDENYWGSASAFSYPTYENASNQTVNSFTQSSNSGFNWTWTNTLGFHKQFATDHDLKLLVGTEAYRAKSEFLGGTRQDYFSFDPNYTALGSGAGLQTNSGGRYGPESLFSLFARLDYSFLDKYLIGATIRRDGSSKFSRDNQYGWFPAFSGAWRISQEGFMKDITWLKDLKIRGSWGIMGNQINLGLDNAFYTYALNVPGSYYDINRTNNTNVPGFQNQQIGNPAAKWEKDINANFGIDATLFDGALELSADYYRKDIRDLLFNPAVPGTEGAGIPPYVNIARMKNDGLDLSVAGHKTISKDLKLDATLTFTTFHNVITKVTDNADYFLSGEKRHFGDFFIRNEVGHPVGAFYGYQITGFWNSTEEISTANQEAQHATNNPIAVYQPDIGLGRFRYADVNKDGQVTPDDRTFLGNPNPKFNYGFNLRASYKDFDLSLFLYGVYGNKLFNVTNYWKDFFSSYTGAKSKVALYDSWRPDHQNAKVAIQETKQYNSVAMVANSYFVENGSYLRLKNIQLGYTIPAKLLSRAGIQKLRVYVQAANLFTVTKYTGLDPEISGTVLAFGVDEGIYPNQRQFLAGINLNF